MNWFGRKPASQGADNLGELAHLIGRATRIAVVVVTDRGTEIPINHANDWTVTDLASLLAEIDAWPETTHPLGATA